MSIPDGIYIELILIRISMKQRFPGPLRE